MDFNRYFFEVAAFSRRVYNTRMDYDSKADSVSIRVQ